MFVDFVGWLNLPPDFSPSCCTGNFEFGLYAVRNLFFDGPDRGGAGILLPWEGLLSAVHGGKT